MYVVWCDQKRLEKRGIFCLHSNHIPLCGGIDVVAFDKVRDIFAASEDSEVGKWFLAQSGLVKLRMYSPLTTSLSE